MQKPAGYESQVHVVKQRDRYIEIENRIPILTDTQRKQRKKEIEQKLYDIFSGYQDG